MRREPVRLRDVVRRLEREALLVSAPAADPVLTGISDDSRRTAGGDLFCTWAGTASDGHAFLAAAEGAGAVAAVVERPVSDASIPQVVTRDGRRAAALAAALVMGDPGAVLKLVGVTGTNGKTTTVWILRHLLGLEWTAASMGTLGVLAGDRAPDASGTLTTPGPVELARALRELVDTGVGAVAAEVSSHALEQGRVHALRFDAAVFLNLTRDHLDYHGTFDAYRAAKRSLAELLRPGGAAVIDADDAAWDGLADRVARTLRFGLGDRPAEVRASAVDVGPFGVSFRLRTEGSDLPVALPLLGAHNVQNALAAAAACLALGFNAAAVADRLATVPQVPGRLERVTDLPCPVLIDYAHTPDALERVLSALRPLVPGRLIVLFGAGGDRDPGKRPLMGGVAARLADVPVVTSDNPRTEHPESIIDDILRGAPNARFVREVNRRQAIGLALAEARPGDVVLLAGKGHETYQVLGTERVPFDEREIVKEWGDRHARGGAG